MHSNERSPKWQQQAVSEPALSSTRKVSSAVGLVGWVAVSLAAGALGGLAASQASSFYQSLDRAAWAPPSWLFGPVWTVLYLAMAVAAWLVWRERGWQHARVPLTLFLVQLAINALWTPLFFTWKQGELALLDILLLDALIIATIGIFWHVKKFAAVLLIPYLCWVLFASALTYSVWQRNPGLL